MTTYHHTSLYLLQSVFIFLCATFRYLTPLSFMKESLYHFEKRKRLKIKQFGSINKPQQEYHRPAACYYQHCASLQLCHGSLNVCACQMLFNTFYIPLSWQHHKQGTTFNIYLYNMYIYYYSTTTALL